MPTACQTEIDTLRRQLAAADRDNKRLRRQLAEVTKEQNRLKECLRATFGLGPLPRGGKIKPKP
jgi:septal ring factor EnvC (AmiA/AmiB activator)